MQVRKLKGGDMTEPLKIFITIGMSFSAAYLSIFLFMVILDVLSASHYNAVNRNYNIIMHAIHNYRMDTYSRHRIPEINYEDMIDIADLHKRFWDWGYKHILTPDKYEVIKNYIKK